MTSGAAPRTPEELNAELRALLLGAHENGVDVEGAFGCRNGGDHPDWDVVVTTVEPNDGPE